MCFRALALEEVPATSVSSTLQSTVFVTTSVPGAGVLHLSSRRMRPVRLGLGGSQTGGVTGLNAETRGS